MMNVGNKQSFVDEKLRDLTAYESSLLYVIRSIISDAETVKDVLQDTYIKAIKALQSGAYLEQNYFKSRLCTIARNEAINVHRGKHRQSQKGITLLSYDGDMSCASHVALVNQSADVRVDYGLVQQAIYAIIADRSDIVQNVFNLFFLCGEKMDTIAGILDVPLNTVRSTIHRMRHEIIPKGLVEMGYTEDDMKPWL